MLEKKSFNYFKYKIFAIIDSSEKQNEIYEIAKEEGFNPLILEKTGEMLSDEFNFIIAKSIKIFNLEDINKSIKLAILDDCQKEEALKNLRSDIDVLSIQF